MTITEQLATAMIRVMPFVDDAEDVQNLFPESACSIDAARKEQTP